MTVKRYDQIIHNGVMEPMQEGKYVTYSDYQKLVAENVALRRIALGYHILTAPEREAPTEQEIDAAIAEIEAVGAEKMFALAERAMRNFCNPAITELAIEELESLAANLFVGRKG